MGVANALMASLLVSSVTLSAQPPAKPDAGAMPLLIPVASVTENYLRYAQTLGEIPLHAWTIRPFTPIELDLLAARASDSLRFAPGDRPLRRIGNLRWQLLPVNANAWYNSTAPFGWNDGAVWRGRGLTTAIDGGFAARWRWFSVTLDPIVFVTQNQKFPLARTVDSTASPFADPAAPSTIDRPQRFGDGAYARLDAGQSTVRVDALGVTIGASTANQWTGPMSEWPYILSNNAPGFPHLFAGSSRPWSVGVGRIHGRVFYGDLSQSPYTSFSGVAGRRFGTGASVSFMPELFTGLEIGATRMFESFWPQNGIGWRELRRPFEAFLKEHVVQDPSLPANGDNQLASMFARWVVPSSGFEAYGEYGREDHNVNSRDAIVEPDHDATIGLGLRKAWLGEHGRLSGLRGEIFNMQPSSLARHRGAAGYYTNVEVRQGHTERGQVLGAGFAAISGAGAMLAYEQFMPSGAASSWSLTRMLMRDVAVGDGNAQQDVEYALAAQRTRRVGSVGVTYGITAVYEMNRYFRADVGNIVLTTGMRW